MFCGYVIPALYFLYWHWKESMSTLLTARLSVDCSLIYSRSVGRKKQRRKMWLWALTDNVDGLIKRRNGETAVTFTLPVFSMHNDTYLLDYFPLNGLNRSCQCCPVHCQARQPGPAFYWDTSQSVTNKTCTILACAVMALAIHILVNPFLNVSLYAQICWDLRWSVLLLIYHSMPGSFVLFGNCCMLRLFKDTTLVVSFMFCQFHKVRLHLRWIFLVLQSTTSTACRHA